MIKNLKEFREYFRKINKDREYEDQIFIEHRTGKEKIDFFDEFVKVFGEEWNRYLVVDENIGLITDNEIIYIYKSFLEECLEKNIKGQKAIDLYYEQLEEYENKSNN